MNIDSITIQRDMASVKAILVIFAMFELVSSESEVSDLTVKEKRVLDRVSDILDKSGDGMSLREFQVFVQIDLKLEVLGGLNLDLTGFCVFMHL